MLSNRAIRKGVESKDCIMLTNNIPHKGFEFQADIRTVL